MITKRKVTQPPPRRLPGPLAYRVSSFVLLAGLVLVGFALPARQPVHRSLLAGATPAASVTYPPGYLTQVNGYSNFGSTNLSAYTPVNSQGGAGLIDYISGTVVFSLLQSSTGGISQESSAQIYSQYILGQEIPDNATAIAVSPAPINETYVVAVATQQGFIDIYTETSAGILSPVGTPYSPTITGLSGIRALAFSPISFGSYNPDGFVLAAADSNGIQTFSVNTGGIALLTGYSSYTTGYGLAFSPDGSLLAEANANANPAGDGDVQLFAVSNGGGLTLVQSAVYVSGHPSALAFNPSGNVLAVAEPSSNGLVLLGVGGGLISLDSNIGLSSAPSSVAFSPDGNLLAVGSTAANTVALYSGNFTGSTLSSVGGSPFPTANSPQSLSFSPSGDFLEAGGGSGLAVFSVARSTSISVTFNAAVSASAGVVYGEGVTFNAAVSASGSGVPAPSVGTVQFYVGGKAVGQPVSVSNGTATLQGGSDLSIGANTVTATYSGDSNPAGISYETSSSAPTTLTLNQSATSTSVQPSASFVQASASSLYYGEAVSFGTTVTATAPGSGTPTGSVILSIPLPTAPSLPPSAPNGGIKAGLNGGSYTFGPYTGLPVGVAKISATYLGDTNFSTSTSAVQDITVSPDPTQTAITSAPSSSSYGQSDTFNVAVTPVVEGSNFSTNNNAPPGTVTLTASTATSTATVGTGTLSPSGDVVITTTALPVGTDEVTATYAVQGASGDFAGSRSQPSKVAVAKASSSVALTSDANPSVYGQQVSFTATVSAVAPGSGTPTGTVSFAVDGNPIGGVAENLSGSSVTSPPISDLSVGSHTVTATYSGDANFAGTSTTSAEQVNQKVGQAAVSTTVLATPTSSVYGSAVSLTATVAAAAPGAGVPTGSVTFYVGGNPVGSPATLANGEATEQVSSLPGGADSITAVYSGDNNFAASTASEEKPLTFAVTPAPTSTVVTSATNPVLYGQPVSFTATVSTSVTGVGPPGGAVQFYVSGNPVGSPVTLSAGKATSAAIGTLAVGSDTVTAAYSGDTDFAGSSAIGGSAVVSETVNQAPTKITVTGPSTVTQGQAATFQVTVSGGDPPSGSVVFSAGSANLGTAPLNNAGQATFTTSALPSGNVTVAVTYTGDPNFQGATGTAGVSVNAAASNALPSGPTATNTNPSNPPAQTTSASTPTSTPGSASGSTSGSSTPSASTTGSSSPTGSAAAGSAGAATPTGSAASGSAGAATPTGAPGTGGTPPARTNWLMVAGGLLVGIGVSGLLIAAELSRRYRAMLG